MADSPTFDWACDALDRATPLTRLEAAGVLSMALREAGLESRTLNPVQLKAVLQQLLPEKLERQAIEGPHEICRDMGRDLVTSKLHSDSAKSPEAILTRVTGR